VVPPGHPLFTRLARCSESLALGATVAEDMEEYAEIQAIAALLYRLSATQFEHVLSTFPLVPKKTRERALRGFIDLG
jgi:hypothetical protein